MAISHGMDVNEIRRLAGRLDGQANAVGNVITAVDAIIQEMSAIWKGPDAVKFEGWWRDQHRKSLQTLENHLSGLAQSARNNATEQEQVSGR